MYVKRIQLENNDCSISVFADATIVRCLYLFNVCIVAVANVFRCSKLTVGPFTFYTTGNWHQLLFTQDTNNFTILSRKITTRQQDDTIKYRIIVSEPILPGLQL